VSSSCRYARQRGFSLVEVMVALVVISVGLLGIAKMRALALASTTVASMRSLAAIEAASLASTMHTNRGYWTSTAPNATGGITVTATAPGPNTNISPAALTGGPDCAAGVCTSAQLAGYDLTKWAAEAQQVLPNYVALVNCTAISPVSCTVQITWTEKAVALSAQGAQAQAAPTYTLYVEP